MRIITTGAEASTIVHRPDNGPVGFQCDYCGVVKPLPGTIPGNSAAGTCGYAVTTENAHGGAGRLICYGCADTAQRAEMLTADRIGAYLSADCRTVNTWTGGKLGDVTWWNPCELNRKSYWHDSHSFRSVRVRDVHGQTWTGRGSPGVLIRLRRTGKSAAC